MGGDHAPGPLVAGAVAAARDDQIPVLLVGDRSRLAPLLEDVGSERSRIEIADAGEVIGMGDHPTEAVRSKPDSSLVRSIDALREERGGAVLSMGNSGATMAGAVLGLRRVRGVRRPVVASLVPLPGGSTVWADIGANAECDAIHLAQFAQMAVVYSRSETGIARPTVGLLNMGHEEGKGPQLVRDAAALIAQTDLNFVGNVEPQMMMRAQADVVIADGFTMNIAVKTMEALAGAIFDEFRRAAQSSFRYRIGTGLLLPALRNLRGQLDYREIGAAPLLGVNGLVLIGHGRSRKRAVHSAIRQAHRLSGLGLIDQIRSDFAP